MKSEISIKYPIRVLCVFGSLDRGGAETMCMNLYRHIDRSKIQFDFVTHSDPGGAYEDEIRTLEGRIFYAPRFRGVNIIRYQSWWKNHLINHPEHRIIHGHYFTISKYYFSVCRKMNRITIGHCHTDAFRNPLGHLLIHGVEELCDYRIACSYKAGKLLYPHKNFTILNNAIDTSKYIYNSETDKEVRQEFSLGDGLVLGTVGRIAEVKNPLGILSIFHAVYKERPDAKLLWIGKDGGMKSAVDEKIIELGIKDNVILTGVRSDVPRLLQCMNVFIMPSFSEGIPVALIEAQAAGLKCFVSNTVSKDTDLTGNCFYLPLGKWKDWKIAILNKDTLKTDTSEDIISAGFDINLTVKWLENFYMQI